MPPVPSTRPAVDAARLALACLDLTSLKGDEDDAAIDALADKAAHSAGAPAALCVYVNRVARARLALDRRGLGVVRVATVVSFPLGDASPGALADQIDEALGEGANEIDMVLPWRALKAASVGGVTGAGATGVHPLHGLDAASAEAACRGAVEAARAACGALPLKVILETGLLHDAALIRRAAEIAVDAGADFIKTSTGKAAVHATPDAAQTMLEVIVERGARCGLKVAGGVQTLADAQQYLALVDVACGADWAHPARLRFGASSLWPALIDAIEGRSPGSAAEPAASY